MQCGGRGNVKGFDRSTCRRQFRQDWYGDRRSKGGRQLAVRAEDSDDDDDAERTYAFPPPVDLDAYAAACRLPPAEETEDEREARFQRERCFGL